MPQLPWSPPRRRRDARRGVRPAHWPHPDARIAQARRSVQPHRPPPPAGRQLCFRMYPATRRTIRPTEAMATSGWPARNSGSHPLGSRFVVEVNPGGGRTPVKSLGGRQDLRRAIEACGDASRQRDAMLGEDQDLWYYIVHIFIRVSRCETSYAAICWWSLCATLKAQRP